MSPVLALLVVVLSFFLFCAGMIVYGTLVFIRRWRDYKLLAELDRLEEGQWLK